MKWKMHLTGGGRQWITGREELIAGLARRNIPGGINQPQPGQRPGKRNNPFRIARSAFRISGRGPGGSYFVAPIETTPEPIAQRTMQNLKILLLNILLNVLPEVLLLLALTLMLSRCTGP